MPSLSSRLHGVWRVRRYEDRESADGEWTATYGPGVDGLIAYTEAGWLSVVVAGDDGRVDSYLGSFEVVEIEERGADVVGTLNHRIAASSMPELLNADPERPFRVSGQTLVLGDEQTWRRICDRVG